MINSLVAFKGKSARIVSQTTHKFEIEFTDGSIKKVREKDFRFIHPEFVKISDNYLQPDISILDDFQEEVLSLEEITQWLFDDFNAQSAWQSYLLVEDGLHFYWQKNNVFVRPKTQVESIKSKRELEKIEKENLARCIQNLTKNTFTKQDLSYIKEIEKVALGVIKHAKILKILKIENTPENAHKFLLKIGYFQNSFNPYPARFKISQDEDFVVEKSNINRTDLTHLKSFAIDNDNSNDADDAISIDENKIWVHIADVSSVVESCSKLDEYAQERASNLYLPNEVIHMLPISVTKVCALVGKNTNALSVGFELDNNQIKDINIIHSVINVENISYTQADKLLKSDKDLKKLQQVGVEHKKYREQNGAISLNLPSVDVHFKDDKVNISAQKTSASRELVSEMMIIAGRVVAQFTQNNNIPVAYALQDEGSFPQEVLDNKDSLSLSESFQAIKFFARSATSTKPLLHYGLGLDAYLRVTSPLRRYFDLLTHQQLSNFIAGRNILSEEKIKKIIGIVNAVMPSVGKTVRASNEHFKCLYLMQNQSWHGNGIVIDIRNNKALLMIEQLGMVSQMKFKSLPKLDEEISLKIKSVNLVERLVEFKET